MNLSKRIEKLERSNLSVGKDVFQQLRYVIIDLNKTIVASILYEAIGVSSSKYQHYFNADDVEITVKEFNNLKEDE